MKDIAMSNNFVQRKRRQQIHKFKKRKGVEDFMNCALMLLIIFLVEIKGF